MCRRLIFVLDGTVNVTVPSAKADKVLHADDYAYIPADTHHSLASDSGAGLLLFERRCVIAGEHISQDHTNCSANTHQLAPSTCIGGGSIRLSWPHMCRGCTEVPQWLGIRPADSAG